MRVNYIEEYIEYDENTCWGFKDIMAVEKLSINGVLFVGVQNTGLHWVFFYDDLDKFAKLTQNIAENPRYIEELLLKYENDFGAFHMLLSHLVYFVEINYPVVRFWDECKNVKNKEKYSHEYEAYKKIKYTDSLKKTCEIFVSVLPENIKNTKRNVLKEQCKDILDFYKKIFGNDFEKRSSDSKEILSFLKKIDSDMLQIFKKVNADNMLLNAGIDAGVIDVVWTRRIRELFSVIMPIIMEEMVIYEQDYLVRRYGDLSEQKKNFKKMIIKLNFEDALELYRSYRDTHETIKADLRSRNGECLCENRWNDYVSYYNYGSILISEHINKINRNKAKNRPLHQKDIDEAMVYFYDASSAEEAYRQKQIWDYKENKSAGDAGEKNVNYILSWLDATQYIPIESRSVDKAGGKCILLRNSHFIDEAQEYDHIIVSEKGIFVIETKNLKGRIVIDDDRNWSREVDGSFVGMKNPLQQVRRHEKVLKSFLPKDTPIISIICIANEQAIIEGTKNFELPIVKSDRLDEFIETYTPKKYITQEECQNCIKLIYAHME